MRKLIICILIISVIMATSSELVHKDKRGRFLGDKIATADSTGADQLQPLDQDWLELDVSVFSFSDTDEIAISDTNMINRMQVGDKLELTQSGTTKYFYIIKVGTSTINVTAGDDYSYTDNAITRLRTSRLPLPLGFPNTFLYGSNGDLILTDEDDTEIAYIGDGFAAFEFFMIGYTVILALNISDADITANTQTIRVSTPFLDVSSGVSIFWSRYIRPLDAAGRQDANITFISSSVVVPRLDIMKDDLANWAVGGFGVLTNFIFEL